MKATMWLIKDAKDTVSLTARIQEAISAFEARRGFTPVRILARPGALPAEVCNIPVAGASFVLPSHLWLVWPEGV